MKRLLELDVCDRDQDQDHKFKNATQLQNKNQTLGLTPIIEVLAELELSTSKKGSKDDYNLVRVVGSKTEVIEVDYGCD